MDQLDLKERGAGGTFYRRRRSDELSRPPKNETCGQGGTHLGNPRSYQTSFPLAVRQVLGAERQSNAASLGNPGGIEHNRWVSASDFADAGCPKSCGS